MRNLFYKFFKGFEGVFKKTLFIYFSIIWGCSGSLLMHCLFSSCGKGGCSLAVCRLLVAVASRAAQAVGHAGSGSRGARAQSLHSMCDLPRPETNPCLLYSQTGSSPLSHQGSPYFIKLKPSKNFLLFKNFRNPG